MMINCVFLVMVLFLGLQAPREDVAKNGFPQVEGSVLSSIRIRIGNNNRSFILTSVARKLPAPKQGREYLFEVLDYASGDENSEVEPRTLFSLPDIPTHDIVGVPLPSRFGGLAFVENNSKLFIIIGKCAGTSMVIRVYQANASLKNDGTIAVLVPNEWVGQTERHYTTDSQSPAEFSVKARGEELELQGRSAAHGAKQWNLIFDLSTKVFRDEEQNP